ncbi:PLP-dependent aminotransferase family protein [Dactylosporangium matsuzakiense]|uniref:Aminotransferase class I/II n=1 Tax=Dactylosporangium matsuzakiense TaxID=53360 RepID=A0A9W6KSX5_9ACTN|nr:PLP-dependent aminotransferase family protein [Dactylosporangium matsuzakiense]UWZ41979.1 aminotransferase class I/II-fold pyridoxal phosphate-dependent enzyme [Dactylosporangium matsuzakiense]GLL04944.1 aminotransferase class I/II [Dactylosporangium matsuzakiense]
MITQFTPRPGVLDLGWGHPRPDLLPVAGWRRATASALEEYSWQALTYGATAGPAPLVEWLGAHLPGADAGSFGPGECFVTAGASQALALAGAVLVRPGDVVLAAAPTYHLAFTPIRDLGATLLPAPGDGDGPDPDATAALVDRLRREGRRVAALYLVPTFANPSGTSLPLDRRAALIRFAQRSGVTIIEDDTYREMAYDGPAPPSLWSRSGGDGVVRLGSFAKTVAPGLRLGWINAGAGTVRSIAALGHVHSGGGVNHTNALAMAAFGRSGDYDRHLARVRDAYREQRDALARHLRAAAPELTFTLPAGGWFLWVRLPPGLTAEALQSRGEHHGVGFAPGPLFYCDGAGGSQYIRLAFSMLPPDDLATAAHRLAAAVTARQR